MRFVLWASRFIPKNLGRSFLASDANGDPVIDRWTNHSSSWGHCPERTHTFGWKNDRCLWDFLLIRCCMGCADGGLLCSGKGIDFSQAAGEPLQAQEISISETVINFIPMNIFDALSKGSIIQIIVFGLFFGVALNRFMQKKPESALYGLIVDLNEVVIAIIRYVMIVAPIGIFALIASTISSWACRSFCH